jgi:hypothetical protein
MDKSKQQPQPERIKRKRRTKAEMEEYRNKDLEVNKNKKVDKLVVTKVEKTKKSLKNDGEDINSVLDNKILSNNDKLKTVIDNLSKSENFVVLEDGARYSTVSERVKAIRNVFGFDLKITSTVKEVNSEYALVEARIYIFKGEQWELIQIAHSHEQKTASAMNLHNYVEIAETSAIGRALGFLGIFGDEFSSAENITNSINSLKKEDKPKTIVRSKSNSYKSTEFKLLLDDNKNKILKILKDDSSVTENMLLNNKKDSKGNKLKSINDMSNSDALEFISIYNALDKDDLDTPI